MPTIELSDQERETIAYLIHWEEPDPDFSEVESTLWVQHLEALSVPGPVLVSHESLRFFSNALFWFEPDPEMEEDRAAPMNEDLINLQNRMYDAIQTERVLV